MDINAHTHNPRLYRAFTPSGLPRPWKLDYGDQTVTVCHGWFNHIPSPDQIKKSLAQAVAFHDESSRKAAYSQKAFEEKINDGDLFSIFTEENRYGSKIEKKEWGSNILKEKENVTTN